MPDPWLSIAVAPKSDEVIRQRSSAGGDAISSQRSEEQSQSGQAQRLSKRESGSPVGDELRPEIGGEDYSDICPVDTPISELGNDASRIEFLLTGQDRPASPSTKDLENVDILDGSERAEEAASWDHSFRIWFGSYFSVCKFGFVCPGTIMIGKDEV